MITAFGNLEIGSIEGSGDDPGGSMVSKNVRSANVGYGAVQERAFLPEDLGDAHELTGTDKHIDLGQGLTQLLAIPLSQAPGDDELLGWTVLLVASQLQDGIDRFFLRFVNEAAGINHKHVGPFRVEAELVPLPS